MIVLKDKDKNSKIYIPRTKITNVTGGNNNTSDLTDYYTKKEVDELIDNVEVDLSNYYTKEEIDEIVENTTIPHLVINKDFNGYESGDFESVRQAIINKKPFSIYIPSVLGGYLTPNAVDTFGGQITLTYVYHTNGKTMYYGRCYLHTDNVNNSVESVSYATSTELLEKGTYTLLIDWKTETTSKFYGINTSTLKYYADNNRNIEINVKDGDVIYKGNNISFTEDGGAIFYTEKVVDGELYNVRWVLGYDDDWQENYIDSVTETKIVGGGDVDLSNYYTKTQSDNRFQPIGDYLTTIPSEYITESELNKKDFATNSDVTDELGKLESSLEGDINTKQDKLVSGTNIKTINGNSLLGSGDIVVEGGGSSNVVELTQAEYDALGDNVDADTLYLISDATISANYKTINGESILGEGNIEISGGTTDLSDYYTKTECDGKFQLKGNYLTSVPSEYVTETELNDAIDGLGGSDIPYVVIEYKNAMTLVVISGDLQTTLTAAKNKQPFLAYFYNTYNMYGMPKNLYPFTYVYVGDDGATLRYHTEVGSSHKDITVMCEYDTETQEYTLETLGTQQHNYLSSIPSEYVTETELETTLTNKDYATTTYVDTQIGNINTILENIIG